MTNEEYARLVDEARIRFLQVFGEDSGAFFTPPTRESLEWDDLETRFEQVFGVEGLPRMTLPSDPDAAKAMIEQAIAERSMRVIDDRAREILKRGLS